MFCHISSVPAVVTKEHAAPRSLKVATGDGGVYRRNQLDLLKSTESILTIRTKTHNRTIHIDK